MILKIKVIANARKEEIIEEGGIIKVKVNKPAIDGKANVAVIELLAHHYGVKKKMISILKGEFNSSKTIEIRE